MGESRLHQLNKILPIQSLDGVLHNTFTGCLNRETGLYVKCNVKISTENRKCLFFVMDILARALLPALYGGLNKHVFLIQLGCKFHVNILHCIMCNIVKNAEKGLKSYVMKLNQLLPIL